MEIAEHDNVLKRMRNAMLANVGIAIGCGFGFLLTGSPVLGGEAGHSGSDGVVHFLRYQAEKKGIDQNTRKFRTFLAGSLAIPAGFLLLHSYETSQDLLDVINGAYYESKSATFSLVAALAIGGANGFAYLETSKIDEHSLASKATHNHTTIDALVSGGFVGTLLLEGVGVENASLVGGTVFSFIAGVHLAHEAYNTATNNDKHIHKH